MTGDASVGTCFGFAVRSSLPFAYLRGGEGTPLGVSAPSRDEPEPDERLVREWTPVPGLRFHGKLYEHEGAYRLWIAGVGWFDIDPRVPEISVPDGPDAVRREERLWGIPALVSFFARGDTALHAAAIEIDGGAVLVAAPSFHGKTTLAAAFHAAGYRLLAEDLTCLRFDGHPSVLPGPAMLRLRPDVADGLDLPGVRRLCDDGQRVHFALGDERRGDCRPVPVRAIVFLREPTNGIRMSRAPVPDAIRDLFALSFKLRREEDLARAFSRVGALADAAEIWDFERPLRLDALADSVDAVVRHV